MRFSAVISVLALAATSVTAQGVAAPTGTGSPITPTNGTATAMPTPTVPVEGSAAKVGSMGVLAVIGAVVAYAL